MASYSYQGRRLVTASTRNGLATAYAYDDGERLTEITQRRTGNQELVSQFLYGYDPAGEPHGGDRDAAAAGCDAGGDGGRVRLRRRPAAD